MNKEIFSHSKKELQEIKLMNVVLCLSVVMIHLTASPLGTLRKDSIWFFVIFLINKGLCFCVPAFLFLSGFKLYQKYQGEKINLKTFWYGRIKKIVVPYIIAFLVYFLYYFLKSWINLKELPQYFFLGTLVAHFYYIVIAIQAYFIFPWIQKGFRKWDKLLLIVSLLSTILFQNFIYFPYSDRAIVSYLFYFVLGMFLAKYPQWIQKFKKEYCMVFGIIAVLHILFSYLSIIGKMQYRGAPLINIIYVIFAILVLYNSCAWITKKIKKEKILLERINQNSYLIYLYHILLLQILQNEIFCYLNLSIKYQFIFSCMVIYCVIVIFSMAKKPPHR